MQISSYSSFLFVASSRHAATGAIGVGGGDGVYGGLVDGGGVVRHEFGAKATRRGTERESRRRRHERGFRPRGILRDIVSSRSP